MNAPNQQFPKPDQLDMQILDDVAEFYFGDYAPWINHVGHHESDDDTITIIMVDPDADDDFSPNGPSPDDCNTYELSANDLHNALHSSPAFAHLCCREEIAEDGLGSGCAHDLNVVLQVACYGRIVFA